jgi:tetratricopeptide (TPR) repeat protein
MTHARIFLAALLLAATPALAQAPAAKPKEDAAAASKPPAAPPKTRAQRLDELFARLKAAPDADAAKPISQSIELLWLRSGSDTVDLLMTRALESAKGDNDTAITLLDSVVGLAPDYAEAFNRRATIYFIKKDYERSMLDIREVLNHEPRHFNAWSGLGRILQDVGYKKRALAAYRKAIELNPHLDGLKRQIESLSVEVEGRDI